jgi:hypothetical protein
MVEDNAYNVLAYAQTFEEIAVKWHHINSQKVIVEKMRLVASGSSRDSAYWLEHLQMVSHR